MSPNWLQNCCCFISIVVAFSSGSSSKSNTLILVSIDGLSWELVRNSTFASRIPNLQKIATNGVNAKYMKNQFPTTTWPYHQSVMTGLYPENHGIVSNYFWDPNFKDYFLFDYACSNFEPRFWEEAEPIWLTYQKNGGKSAIYFWPGFSSYDIKPTYSEAEICTVNCTANKTIWDDKGQQCVVNYSIPFDQRVDKIIGWMKSPDPPKFVALYIDEPDWKGHECGYCEKYKDAVELVDKTAVGHLLKRLEAENLLETANIIVTSDHGFMDTSVNHTLYLEDFIDTKLITTTSTGASAHIWVKDESFIDEIYRNLTNKHTKMAAYKKADIPEELHWKNNDRIPPILVLMDGGWLLMSRSKAPKRATHGWSNSIPAMWSVFMATGPDFKTSYEMKGDFENIDLYPMMCYLLGIEPLNHDGSMDRIAQMLVNPPSKPSFAGSLHLNLLIIIITLLFTALLHKY